MTASVSCSERERDSRTFFGFARNESTRRKTVNSYLRALVNTITWEDKEKLSVYK